MKKLKAVWELMRLEHGFMIFIGILIGSIVTLGNLDFPSLSKIILTFFTALFLEASTFALNDYFDLDIDKKNKRYDRPLVRGDLHPKTALILFSIFFPLGIICSFFVNMTCFIIALITAFFAVIYDYYLKKIKLLGNFYIAYVMAIPFVFGGAAVLTDNSLSFNISPSIFIIALIAFFAGSGREIMKDIQDFEGDIKKGVRSFPKYIGIRKTSILASFFYIIAIILSFLPFMFDIFTIYYRNIYYISIIILTDVMLMITSLQLIFNKDINLKTYRKTTLVAIFIGLIGFLIGSLVG